MDEITYTIYDVAGLDVDRIRLLVHVALEPDNALTFSSAVVRKDGRGIVLERVFNEWVTSMWQSPSGRIFAASMAGNIHTAVQDTWNMTNLGERVFLNNIWGLNDDHVYCCGMDGVLLARVGGAWSRAEGLRGDLIRIGGTAENDLYILGEKGTIFHFNGSRWSALDSPTNRKLVYLLCVSKDLVYVCGRSGTLFRGSGNRWEQVRGYDSNLYSLVQFKNRIFVGAGLEGVLEVHGNEVVPFRKDTVAYGLQVIGDRLFAFGDTRMDEFDGQLWSRESFNFGSVIGQ